MEFWGWIKSPEWTFSMFPIPYKKAEYLMFSFECVMDPTIFDDWTEDRVLNIRCYLCTSAFLTMSWLRPFLHLSKNHFTLFFFLKTPYVLNIYNVNLFLMHTSIIWGSKVHERATTWVQMPKCVVLLTQLLTSSVLKC